MWCKKFVVNKEYKALSSPDVHEHLVHHSTDAHNRRNEDVAVSEEKEDLHFDSGNEKKKINDFFGLPGPNEFGQLHLVNLHEHGGLPG